MFLPGIGNDIVPLFGYTKMVKLRLLIRLYAFVLLVILAGIVVHAPLSVGFGVLFPDFELAIKSWKEILLIVCALLALWFVLRTGAWRELARDRIMQLTGLYILLHVVVASALLSGPMATLAGLAIDLRYSIFFVLVYVLIKQAPWYRRRFLQVAVIGALIVVGFAVMQLFLPPDILKYIGYSKDTIQPYLTVDQNHDFVRVNSTMRGPNPLGAYLVVVLGLLAAALVRGRLALRDPKTTVVVGVAAFMSCVALWITYSRSALAGAGLAVFLVAILAMRHRITRRVWIVGCVVLFALVGGLMLGRDSSFVANVIFHENPADNNAINSNEGHVDSLVNGFDRMLRQPIGGGIGSTGSASLMTDSPLVIENQYLFIAHEVGWLGLVLFLAMTALLLVRLWEHRSDWLALGVLASGVGLAFVGMLQPVWVDDTVSIIWWGLAAVAVASGGSNGRETKQKTTRTS